MSYKPLRGKSGLSPLLAIIIGLVVTIVAGILLAQLYFSYAATLSARPAVNIEYVDVVEGGRSDILVINLKNVGNVPVDTTQQITIRIGNNQYSVTPSGSGSPGGVISLTHTGDLGGPGQVVSGTIEVPFTDGSTQVVAFSARIRSA
ncbi:MAG: hypothetical protein QXG25_02730 [Nitrososphaerota archaeon]